MVGLRANLGVNISSLLAQCFDQISKAILVRARMIEMAVVVGWGGVWPLLRSVGLFG